MQQENTQNTQTHSYKIEATESDMMAINILFGNSVPVGIEAADQNQNFQEVTQHTIDGLFGAANGIMRSALLLKYVASNKPEIFVSLLAIADAISTVGEGLATKLEQDIKIGNFELSDEELQPIIDIISQIHIDLPEELQAHINQNSKKEVNDESNSHI